MISSRVVILYKWEGMGEDKNEKRRKEAQYTRKEAARHGTLLGHSSTIIKGQ